MISHPGNLASKSPFNTATLPGITSFLLLILGSTSSVMNFEIDPEDNLPAAHAVNTDNPPASLIHKLQGTPERSNSPDTTKYVSAKSTVVRQTEFVTTVDWVDTWFNFHWLLRI